MTIRESFPNLPETTKNQLDFIEKDFGHEVVYSQEEKQNDLVAASVTEINAPAITYKSAWLKNDSDIIHEIWHLYYKSLLNINNYNFEPNSVLEKKLIKFSGVEQEFALILYQLYSSVEHFFFLRQIDKKYKPYFFIESTLHNVKKNKKEEFDNFAIQYFAIQVFQIKLLFDDTGNGKDELDYLKDLCSQAYEIGLILFEEIKKFKIEQEPDIMVALIKIMWQYEGEIKYTKRNRTIYFD